MNSLAVAFWIAVPLLVAGLLHVTVIKLQLFPALARIPLDGGLTLRDRRLFGENKTLRGALTMLAATVIAVVATVSLLRRTRWGAVVLPASELNHPVIWGLLAGAGYIVGELPNSFVKRQLDINPGDAPLGAIRVVFWTIDQIDSMLGVVVFLLPLWHPTTDVLLWLTGLTLLAHPAVAFIMYILGLKARIG